MEGSAGFAGLGNMGSAMAENLLKNGLKLFVYNRTQEKARNLLKEGGELVDFPKDLFRKTSVVFSMLANDEALREFTLGPNGLLENGAPGAIHVSMSTVSPNLILELKKVHEEKGVYLLSAPVFGRPEAAEQQKLWICLAGDAEAKKRVSPLLHFMGQKVFDFGEVQECVNAVKIAGNFLILSNIEIMAEAFAFVQKSGADLGDFNALVGEVLFPSPITKVYGERLKTRNFEPAGFRMELGLKDIDLVLQSAEGQRVPMPMAALLQNRLLSGLANDRGHLDWSAISLSAFEDAGIHSQDESN